MGRPAGPGPTFTLICLPPDAPTSAGGRQAQEGRRRGTDSALPRNRFGIRGHRGGLSANAVQAETARGLFLRRRPLRDGGRQDHGLRADVRGESCAARVTQGDRLSDPLLVHGTAQTGINFLGTPDGRPGWADRFAAKGFTVYIVDQVGRGRSAAIRRPTDPMPACPSRIWRRCSPGRNASRSTRRRSSTASQWPGGPGGVRAATPSTSSTCPRCPIIASAEERGTEVDPALIALLEKIGPAILLTHSQAGVFGWAVSDQRPDLVKAHVAVEPNGPTFFDIRFKGGADWYERVGEARARPYGITRVPLHFEPPVSSPADLTVVQDDRAAAPDKIRCWLQAEPARTLPNLARVPAVPSPSKLVPRHHEQDCTACVLRARGAAKLDGWRSPSSAGCTRCTTARHPATAHDDAGIEQRCGGGCDRRLDREPGPRAGPSLTGRLPCPGEGAAVIRRGNA